MKRPAQITVIGNAEASHDAITLAQQAGEALGRLARVIVCGGRGGVMEAAARGAHRAGATVVGVLPGDSLDGGNPYLDVVIPTGIGFARNMTNVLAGDIVVAIGGASGTLNEISFAWMAGRPIVALLGAGGWAERLAGAALDGRRVDTIEKAESIQQLEAIVRRYLGERAR